MKAHLKNGSTWLRWIGGAALVLALTGLFTPTTSSAVYNDDQVGEEVIEVESEHPTSPTAPWTPGGYTGGSSGSPSGPSGGVGGGGGVSSEDADPSTSNSERVKERIAQQKGTCELFLEGTWTKNVIFHDKGIKANKQLVGYRCSSRFQGQTGLVYSYSFYDSRGHDNYACISTADYTDCPDGHTGG